MGIPQKCGGEVKEKFEQPVPFQLGFD